ncbi:D-aspartate oxidase-like [Mercenaria mercenaria]|uniref:D-aspartate oxidase-like n=1 Tax=Mercenaria mercenaria TaxID=6596 RepID=UPI00234FAC36|nr:D-aspartate oxidase-like [Mercenaria mercenaria]XP_045193491.2 D-aspartate oxidase-like [Mercenaria mercenaria]
MYDIVILGAGIVGLSTAVNVQCLLPDRRVTVIADKFTKDTTSDGAAGIFRPSVEKTPVKSLQQYRKWCQESFQWYHTLNRDNDPGETGVIRLSGYHFATPKSKPPEFHYGITELTERELADLPGNYRYGWKYTTLMIECRRYLPWLTKRFISRGGQIEKRNIESIHEFAGRCSVFVNCAGLNSRTLFNDKEVFPVRGHLLRVKAPWIKHFYVWDDASSYIYPGQDNVVLGGTRQKDQYGTSDGRVWFDDVKARCEDLLPGLKNVEAERKWVGLRPHRTFIRLEAENITLNGKQLKVVHNYGHGANGIALSWGTGLEASQMVKKIVMETRNEIKAKL